MFRSEVVLRVGVELDDFRVFVLVEEPHSVLLLKLVGFGVFPASGFARDERVRQAEGIEENRAHCGAIHESHFVTFIIITILTGSKSFMFRIWSGAAQEW